MIKKIATFKDLDTLASLDIGTSAGYISDAENEQCVTKGNFDTVSTKTIAAKGNGLMFVDGSESSKYESNRLILLDDVQYISEITAVLVSAPNIPAKGGSAYATWKLSQSYKVNGDASPSVIEWTVDGSTVSASSKGTTISAETNVANSTATVTKNGKSISLSQMIKQDLNKMVSLSGTTSTFSYGTKIVAGGGSVSPTLSGNGGTVTFSSTATLAASSCEGYKYTRSWSATNSGLWTLDASNGKLTATSKLTNIGNETTSMTVTGSCTCKVVNPSSVGGDTLSKNATATATAKQNGNYVTELIIGSHSLSYAAIGAGATSASPTHNAGTLTYKFSSGSTTTTKPADTYGTLSDTHTYTLAESKNGFTSVNSSNGTLTATSYGTTIGNARTSATVTCTRTCKWTPTSSYNAAGTITKTGAATATCTQNGNYVIKVEPKPSIGVAHVKYSNITAGGTTSSPQGTGAATYTFSSGSTTTDSSGSPSFGGSASYSRTYAEKVNSDVSDSFSVNTTNGTVTTSHRGTTPGDARSVTVTATLVVKYTHATGMSAPNASVSGTLVNDVVVTQNENKITSYGNWTAPTVTVNPDSFAAAGGTATITISGDSTRQNTWSSGSKSTDTAYKSNKSASFATISSDYKTLTVGVNTTGSNRTGHVYVDWSFESDNNVVKSVVSNEYSQVGQSDCTLTLTGSTKVYHETATIIGKASVAGTIYWGTSQTSMTQSTSVSANVDTTITNRTSLGTTTIYAYFVPTDKNYKTLGSSSAYHTSASAKITQASDASITITTSNKTYNGSAQTVVTCDPTHGVSTWALGYATSSSATADSGVTWIADKTNLSLTNAGTYYIWRRWTADGNHSNSNSGAKIDATVTISKKAATVTAGSTSKTYDGSALTYKNATLSGQVSGHTLNSYTCTGSITNVGSANNVPSAAKIYSGSTDVTANYNITYKNGTLTVSNASFTVSAPNQTYTYTGSAQGAAITVSGLKGSQTATIKYGTTSGTYDTTTAPKITNANEDKTIYWQVTAPNHATQTGSYTITMNKATPTMTLTGASKTYDGNTYYVSAKASVAGTVYYGTTSATSGMTSTKSVSANTSANLTGRKDAGTTTVYAYFVPTDTTNYNSLGSSSNDHTSASVTISKATGYLTATTTNRTYTGSAQNIGTISTNSGTYYFGLGSSTTSAPTSWGAANKALTATTAGTYYVWAKCDGATNYNAVSQKYIGTVVINKATPTMTLAGSNKTYNGSASYITGTASVAGKIYYGTTSATSGMSTAVSVSANTATNLTSITNAGTLTVYAYFVPTDGTNYNSLGSSSNDHASKSITISKATGYLTATTTNRTYTGSAQTIATISTNSGSYYFGLGSSTTSAPTSWGAANKALTATTAGTYYVWAKCDASTNYNAVSAKYIGTVTIGKATGSITVSRKTLTYNGSAQTIATATATGTYYLGLGSSSTSVPTSWGSANTALTATTAGTYYVWAKCDAGTNHNAVSAYYVGTAVINKKATTAPTLTAGYKTTYDGSAVYAKAASVSGNPAGKIYYGASSGATTYSITASTKATNLSSMGRTDVGTTTIYAFFRPTDTTNYSDSSVASTTVKVVNKANGSCTVSLDDWTYGSPKNPSASSTTNSGASVTYTYYKSDQTTSLGATKPTTVGTYYVTATFAATTNYNACTSSKDKFVISKATPTLTLTGTTITYDGSSKATVKGKSNVKGTIYYGTTSGMGSSKTATANTAYELASRTTGGTTTVYAAFVPEDTTNYNSLGSSTSYNKTASAIVNKASGTCTISMDGWTYGETAKSPSSTTTTDSTSVSYTYYNSAGTSLGATRPSNAGTYSVTATWAATTNYNACTSSKKSFTIAKANGSCTVSLDDWIYGSPKNPSASSTTNSGASVTYTYYKSDQTTSLGATKPTTVGTYYVTATFAATTNYNACTSSKDKFVISKATPTLTLTGTTITYDGSSKATVKGKSNVKGIIYYGTTSAMGSSKTATANTEYELASRTTGGTTTVYAAFVPEDTTNYNSVGSSTSYNKTADAKVNKATGSCTISMDGWTYGETAKSPSSTTTTDSTSVSYTYYNSAGTSLGATRPSNAGTYSVTATWAATTNYNACTSSKKSFTIAKANGSGTLSMSGWTYGNTANSPSVTTASNGSVTYTYYKSDKTTVIDKPTSTSSVGKYYVKASVGAGTNHTAFNLDFKEFNISQRKVTYTATDQSKTYDGTALTADNTASLTSGTLVSGHAATVTCSGSITNYSSTGATKTLTTVTIKSGSTDVTPNYNVSYVNGKLTINKKPSTITFNNSTLNVQCLNSSTKLTSATVTDVFTGATLSDGGYITYSLVSSDISGVTLTSSSSRKLSIPKDTDVGTYTVTVKASQSNSNYSSADKTATITIKVDPDTLKDGFSGTLSIDSSADLSAGADSRTITWGAIYQTWANGGGKYYYSSNNAYLDISCNNSTAGIYISIDEFSYGNSSSTTTSKLTKMTFDIKELSASTLTISLKNYSHSTVKTLTVNVSKNEKTLTSEDILNYGTPTLSIGSGLTASGGSANIGCSVTNIVNYAYKYTSGATSNNTTGKSGSVEWKILYQSCAGGGTRFVKSGNILAHTTMGSNEGVDSIALQAYNIDDTTKTATTGTTIDNYRKHTITSITLTYTDAYGSAYSRNIPTVKYNTSYTYPSGVSGGTTVNQTSDKLNAKTEFTKSFKYVNSNTYSSLNESTGVVTWNTVAPSQRSCTVKCTGTLTSYGSASSKTSSEVYAYQLGTTTDLTVNNNGCYSNCTYSVYITGQSSITVNSSYTTGVIFSKTLRDDPITITVHGTNNMSGSTTKTLKVSYNGGGSSVSINPTGGSVDIASKGGNASVTVTLDRYDYAGASSVITISFG